jgi:hypothetical protein
MDAFILPNLVDAGTVQSREQVSATHMSHEATVIGRKQRGLPFPAEGKGNSKTVAYLP